MAVGDIVTGKLDRNVTGAGNWTDSYQPASGDEVIIFNIILEVDFPLTTTGADLDSNMTAKAFAVLFDGTDAVLIDDLAVIGSPNSLDLKRKIVTILGTPMKLPVTNSIYLRLDSSLSGGGATGNIRLWYEGIQTK